MEMFVTPHVSCLASSHEQYSSIYKVRIAMCSDAYNTRYSLVEDRIEYNHV